ncbi:hypothetical protein ACFV1N_42085 [Streptosporangium canum]|uniref:hypothetical protein n=1 Tax=Streptosporangium canum TaxID=324952 RepID=UPI0036899674
MSIDMNAILRRAAGHIEPQAEAEPVEEQVPPFNGGPRRTAPTPRTMNQLLRDHTERRWYG